MVRNGLLALIQQNMQFFLHSSSASREKPVFMVHVFIDDQKGLLFKPHLYQPLTGSVQGIIEDLIDGIFKVATLFPRINEDHPQREYSVRYLFLFRSLYILVHRNSTITSNSKCNLIFPMQAYGK